MAGVSYLMLVLGVFCSSWALGYGYIPHGKEHYLTDALLREVVDRMGRDLAAAADSYLDSSETK